MGPFYQMQTILVQRMDARCKEPPCRLVEKYFHAEHIVIKSERPNHQIGCKMCQNSKNKAAKSMRNGKMKRSVGSPFSGEQREF